MKYYISAFDHNHLQNKQHVCSNAEIQYFIQPNLPITFQPQINNTNPNTNPNLKGLKPNPTIILLQQMPVTGRQKLFPPSDTRRTL